MNEWRKEGRKKESQDKYVWMNEWMKEGRKEGRMLR